MAKSKASRPHPDLPPTHPGEILREIILPAVNKPLRAVAQGLGVSERALADIVHERRSVTPELAIRLEAAFGRSAPAWLRLQESFDLWHARRAVDVSGIEKFTAAA
ncbi:MAG: HigA family addiction module antitoxin [Hyphomicrobiaceae bacterium]